MGAAIPIRTDIAAEELRRLARQESNGRVACRVLAFQTPSPGSPLPEPQGLVARTHGKHDGCFGTGIWGIPAGAMP
jgi:hypothetical protein